MVRDVTPVVHGLPGLPTWLDRPRLNRLSEEKGITIKQASELLFAEWRLAERKRLNTGGFTKLGG